MSSNVMHRIAELEAQVKSLTAERDALKREVATRQMPSAEDFADAIGKRLVRVEQNLREDFVGKFAGNFLLATETITNRIVTVDNRQTEIERQRAGLETKFKNHIAQVGQTTDTAYEHQRNLLQAFLDHNKEYLAKHDQTLTAQRAIAKECQQAATAAAESAEMCAEFADDYRTVVSEAKSDISLLASETRGELKNHFNQTKKATEDTLKPVYRQVRELTEKEFTRRAYMMFFGVLFGVVITAGMTWLAQPSPYIYRDAARWRSFTEVVTEDQLNRARQIIKEVDEAEKAAEEQKQKGGSGSSSGELGR